VTIVTPEEIKGSPGPARKYMWPALYVIAALVLLAAFVERGLAGPVGVSFLDSAKVLVVFGAFAILPGYLLLRAFGRGRGHWLDWLAPSFCISLAAWCCFAVPAYALAWPLWSALVFAGALLLVAVGLWIGLKRQPGPEDVTGFFPAGSRTWPRVLDLVGLLLVALCAYLSLRPFSYGSDYWLHCGSMNGLVAAGRFTLSDAFHDTAAPHPMYFMNPWYLLTAATAWASRTMTVDATRVIPVVLTPVAVSAFACLCTVFSKNVRARLAALGFFLVYCTLLSNSMEASPDPAIWRQLGIPRWTVLFAMYPVMLGLGVKWIIAGRWPRMIAAAGLNGWAMFIHPQGGQFYLEVLGFLAIGGLLLRDWRWFGRAFLAGTVCVMLIVPFLLMRAVYLPRVMGAGKMSIVAVKKNPAPEAGDKAAGAAGSRTLRGMLSHSYGHHFLSRATTTLFSPFYLFGLLLLPLWWRRARGPGEKRALLCAMGPALVLPVLPLVELLPVTIWRSVIYRSIWAAPVLIASGLGMFILATPRARRDAGEEENEGRRIGWPGWLYFGLVLAVLVAAHFISPRRFRPCSHPEWLFPLGGLGLIAVVALAWSRSRSVVLRSGTSVLLGAGLVLALFHTFSADYRVENGRFAAEKSGAATVALAAREERGGYVLADTPSSAHLTALTGSHVLGGQKSAIWVFSPEHRSRHEDLLRLLRCDQPLADFLKMLKSRDVRSIWIQPRRVRTLADRLESLPDLFPVVAEDLNAKFYGVQISPANLKAEVGRLVQEARGARPEKALQLLGDALQLGGTSAEAANLLEDAKTRLAVELAACLSSLKPGGTRPLQALLKATVMLYRDQELDAARLRVCRELLRAGKLRSSELDLKTCRLIADTIPNDGVCDLHARRRALPAVWSRSNEITFSVIPPQRVTVKSIRLMISASAPDRLPESLRAILRRGDRAISLSLLRENPASGKKIGFYRVENVLLSIDSMEFRSFSDKANTMKLRKVSIELIEASPGVID
jgi:hypothetical protein